ncbi:MAG TPA: succinate dehydrogenase cytochrome b subunit [Fibrobacteraceae bacterium]|nr:succinate dehydrogenase cytochrome b subunit [Fibrobacteraceae bacterium]
MNWIVTYLTSSIGRKQIMGATGALIAVWIFGHMVGNSVLLGPVFDRSTLEHVALGYNSYSWMLTHNKIFIYGMELVMTMALLIHFYLAITLKLENMKARPVSYGVDARKGKRSFASFYMIYSGLWIFGYLIFHLMNLKFGTHYETTTDHLLVAGFQLDFNQPLVIRDMFRTTIEEFSKPAFAAVYVVSMGVLALHLIHAIGSAFQTMGLNHQRWNLIIKVGSIAYASIVSLGFAAEAIACFIIGRT